MRKRFLYFYNISFCFYVFYEESTITLRKKGEKDFGCENYLKMVRKSLFTVLAKDLQLFDQ